MFRGTHISAHPDPPPPPKKVPACRVKINWCIYFSKGKKRKKESRAHFLTKEMSRTVNPSENV